MRYLAQFEMSNELLCSLLNLPDGTEVVGVSAGSNPTCFRVRITNPDLPQSEKVLQVSPGFETIYQTAARFVEWNIYDEGEMESDE